MSREALQRLATRVTVWVVAILVVTLAIGIIVELSQ